MGANVVIKISAQRMVCVGCGSEANATCNCGLNYVPKKLRAAEAIKANPEKSDRAIAEDLGVGHATVSRARSSVVSDETPAERIGRDGKSYSVRPDPPPSTPKRGKEVVRERVIEALMALSGLPPAEEVAAYFDGTDPAVIVSERVGAATEWLINFKNKWTTKDHAQSFHSR